VKEAESGEWHCTEDAEKALAKFQKTKSLQLFGYDAYKTFMQNESCLVIISNKEKPSRRYTPVWMGWANVAKF